MKGAHAGVTELLEPESYLMGTESYEGQLVSHTPAEIRHFLIIDDTRLSEHMDHVNEFSIIISNNLTRLDKIELELCYFPEQAWGLLRWSLVVFH